MTDIKADRTPATVTEDALLRKYKNVREVLPETAVAKTPSSERFHRHDAQSDDVAPACQATRRKADWAVVDVDRALEMGVTPCRGCWRAVLQYLAGDPSSPVEYRDENATRTPPSEKLQPPNPPVEDTTPRPKLSALTDEVMINGGSKYHAPAGDETLCGRSGYRVVERAVIETHYEPCRECFD
uniref:Uncharacterized protein n=1 Tax=Halorubrum distributum TaxID=29283 RepID=A0A2R2NVR0_9EURY|nr:hypothetical protein [Halorubrum litoreum]AKB09806.1 hypothetical protein [Halorubrum litoreum]